MKNTGLKNNDLFSAAIHEIRNSLNPVINLSGVLIRNTADRLTADESSYLEIIERNGRKILNLADEISYLNRLSKNEKINPEVISPVKDIINNAFAAMTALYGYSGCSMVCDIDDIVPGFITDKKAFRIIIENVCLFFLSSGGDKPSLYFNITFSDSKLILHSSRDKHSFNLNNKVIFNKDALIEKGYSAGSVLWLQFAALYINYLDGEVYFAYDNKGDAVFSFLISGVKGVENNCEDGYIPVEVTLNNPGGEFVMLVIDDDIDNITSVNAIIENEFKGAGRVYHAENGVRGLDMLENIKPDIILLDLTLPDISGLSLVKNIKNLFVKKNTVIIAFTGLDIAGDRSKMINYGFDDVIRKPFNIDSFTRTIRKWIN